MNRTGQHHCRETNCDTDCILWKLTKWLTHQTTPPTPPSKNVCVRLFLLGKMVYPMKAIKRRVHLAGPYICICVCVSMCCELQQVHLNLSLFLSDKLANLKPPTSSSISLLEREEVQFELKLLGLFVHFLTESFLEQWFLFVLISNKFYWWKNTKYTRRILGERIEWFFFWSNDSPTWYHELVNNEAFGLSLCEPHSGSFFWPVHARWAFISALVRRASTCLLVCLFSTFLVYFWSLFYWSRVWGFTRYFNFGFYSVSFYVYNSLVILLGYIVFTIVTTF